MPTNVMSDEDRCREILTRLARQAQSALDLPLTPDPKIPIRVNGAFYVGDFYVVDLRQRRRMEPTCCTGRVEEHRSRDPHL